MPEQDYNKAPEEQEDYNSSTEPQEETSTEDSSERSQDSGGLTVEDIYNMSDDEIEKLSNEDLMGSNGSVDDSAEGEEQQDQYQDFQDEANAQNAQEHDNEQANQETTEMSDEEFKRFLTAPFRANNTEYVIDNAKDIQRLMQMGINYQKKMETIRPHLKAVKSLEQSDLLDEDKINFLIDLSQHKPEAISKLLHESGVDTYDLPDMEESDYKPTNHIMSDERYNFQDTVDSLKESESGRTVLQSVTGWDENSRTEIYNNPELLVQLSEHVDNGLYKDAMAELEKQRILNNIPSDMSMLDAYDKIAGHLLSTNQEQYSRGYQQAQSQSQQPRYSQQVVGNNVQNQQQVRRPKPTAKQSASIPTSQSSTRTPEEIRIDPSLINSLSDEEIEKLGSPEDLARYVNNVQFRK